MTSPTPMNVIATGLRFPEGPVAMPDGTVLVVEIAGGALSRVRADGQVELVAHCGGGPNGAAIGPDGRMYICNNGGFNRENDPTGHFDHDGAPLGYQGGSIQVVDLDTGAVEALYTECDGHSLRGPNDIVFDSAGGFWFTDHGKSWSRQRDHGGLYYAAPDGSEIREVIYPLVSPNGVGLSADESTLYVADTQTTRLHSWKVTSPGVLDTQSNNARRNLVFGLAGSQRFDSLAIDSGGHICVATLGTGGGIYDVAPDGSKALLVETGDRLTTNICFGGSDLQTALITCSETGTLRSTQWPRPGLPLAF